MGTLILHSYYRRRPHDLQNTLSGHISPFWRGVLKASMAFASDIKLKGGWLLNNILA